MSEEERRRWNERHRGDGGRPAPPSTFAHLEGLLPRAGVAMEVACGRGEASVWLALGGLEVWASDVSPVAIQAARRLADRHGVAERCRFQVHDLDSGLPAEPPEADLVLCHMFRDPRLHAALAQRLRPGGVLAVATLSEVGSEPGSFRAKPGELRDAFGHLAILDEGEADGRAWIVARSCPAT
ncbi:MAG TPA: class I SAM-dependent methyltransferase [Acidimicrobiia bacterium]|nr:class I SAM-dependent methyltransferase [Acidimicrobiia bacterium]